MFNLKNKLLLSDKGHKNLKKAVFACTLTNLSLMLPFGVTIQIIVELMKPSMGENISWSKMWLLFGVGIIAGLIVFLANKNDYKKTYVTSYLEAEKARTKVAEHLRKLPMNFFNSKDLSELTTNIMGDCNTMEHVLSHIIPQMISNFISITIICIMLAFFDWRLALTTFCTVPISMFIIFISRKIRKRLNKKHVESKMRVSNQVQEYIEGIKVIKSCGLNGEKFTALEKAFSYMRKMSIEMEFITGLFVTGANIILQSGIGITVFVGTYLLTGNQIEVIPLLMFFLIVVRIYGPLLTELTLLPELLYMQVSVERLRRLFNTSYMSGSSSEKITDFNIVFDNVFFSYHKNKHNKKVINKMSVKINEGNITALVGPSGSGKSTMARLIARFWDVDSGEIRIGNKDIRDIEPEHLMEYISFVFQDVVLFHDTVYNNIKIGDMNASEEKIKQAAKNACCDEFINDLPEGYNTVLGENGKTLSGGERQRISIARALLKDAPIVLLDEATASIDPENEIYIQKALSKLIKEKTVIVIAHRLKTIEKADKIIVLNEGELVEEGRHEELYEKDGLYKKMYTIQKDSLGWSV